MITYKDRTFCKSKVPCTNQGCFRYFGEAQQNGAEAWAETFEGAMEEPRVAFSDYSSGCPDYKPSIGGN